MIRADTKKDYEYLDNLRKDYFFYKSFYEKVIEYINNHPANSCHYLLNILEVKNEKS